MTKQDCCDSSGMHTVEQAIAYLLTQARLIDGVETIALDQALGRVLAEDRVAGFSQPPCDNSAMDGYALCVADLPADGERFLPLGQRICAGDPVLPFQLGTAARIFTGAPVPVGADAVVMQENCRELQDGIVLPAEIMPGENIRRCGEDIAAGSVYLRQGTLMLPQHIAVLASQGVTSVTVRRRLRVAVFSTGDELVMPGVALQSGQIYDSNRPALKAQLTYLGCEVVDMGHVGDSLDDTIELLQRAATQADVILTSGGVSVGEEDHVRAAVQALGQISLWKVAMKPGKPLAYGEVAGVPFFGVPGNPVSGFVTFLLFIRPYLLRCQGRESVLPLLISVRADFRFKAGKRREYLRAALTAHTGGLVAQLYPNQGSGVLSSLVWSDCLVVVPEGTQVAPGDEVACLPYTGAMC